MLVLALFTSVCLAAGPLSESSGTVSDGEGSLTVSAGARYIMPQQYRGSDAVFNGGTGRKTGDTNISTPDSLLAPSVSLAAERKTSLELPGLKDIRLKGEFSYAGGSARSTGFVGTSAGNYLLCISIDPAYNWVGGLGPAGGGGSARTRVSISEDNFDLRLGLEGESASWRTDGGGVTAAPVFGAGVYASTQRYKVSTKLVGSDDTSTLVESLRTTDIGPELRAGVNFTLPGGVRASAMASAAALVGWADLDASQAVVGSTAWMAGMRSPTKSATRSLNDTVFSGLFGLTLRGDVPVSEKFALGLEATGRIWTSRPTIDNPKSLGGDGQITSSGATNTGVRIGQDSASELGAALRFSYSF